MHVAPLCSLRSGGGPQVVYNNIVNKTINYPDRWKPEFVSFVSGLLTK